MQKVSKKESDVTREAIKLYKEGKTPAEIRDALNSLFGTSYTREQVRDRIRKHSKYADFKRGAEEKPVIVPEDIYNRILKLIQKDISIKDLANEIDASERVLSAYIEDLREQGYTIGDSNGLIRLHNTVVPQENIHSENWKGEKVIRFGVVSDKHFCSKYQQLTLLNQLYDIFEREAITTVYDPGDICDGFKMRPGHEHELFVIGADDQANYIIEHHPYRKGITTKFILGNHDTSHVKNGGHDIGIPISRAREDMQYLGIYNAKVNITPNCTVELNHPLDGAAYALSYSTQKLIDSLSGGEKSNILLNGHHHKALYMFYRNIHAFECGTLCAQTPWMKGKRIAAHMGGWIIEVHVDDEGTITRCKNEFMPFYSAIKDDYLNWR
jgi:biotin operon repressor/predicted phosphodiesterase